ncbi:protein NYNRIN-like [Cucumis melo var. makuwa]|uniref:Protein NYNRIN-like n=1 Tax=Cucumis melo var. makuwa TaxID=1194695 RepID=A0A5D3DGV2_CUCMM|nr:protein NYNRIN-like [Cucumis melo var. makuwa]
MVRSLLMRFLKVKRHHVILTNPKKEGSEQGEGEISCHHITIIEESDIETLEKDAKDASQSLQDGSQSTIDELEEVSLAEDEPLKCTFGVTSGKFLGFNKYLLNSIVLGAPVPDKPLILYIAALERSLGTLLAQEEEKEKERALYYLSRTLVGAKVNYSPIEKMCLALFFAIDKFNNVMLEHVPRTENKRADAMTNLATTLTMSDDVALNIPLFQRWIMPPNVSESQEANVTISHLIDEEDWRQPIIEYLEHGKLTLSSMSWKGRVDKNSEGSTCRRLWSTSIETKASISRLYIQLWLPGHSRLGDLIWLALLHLNHQQDILAEAIPLREAKKKNVTDFIHSHIIYRYGIPHRIVTDNERQFSNSMIDKLCEKFKFKQYKLSMYNAAANG